MPRTGVSRPIDQTCSERARFAKKTRGRTKVYSDSRIRAFVGTLRVRSVSIGSQFRRSAHYARQKYSDTILFLGGEELLTLPYRGPAPCRASPRPRAESFAGQEGPVRTFYLREPDVPLWRGSAPGRFR